MNSVNEPLLNSQGAIKKKRQKTNKHVQKILHVALPPIGLFIVALIGWQVIPTLLNIPSFVFPTFTVVVNSAIANVDILMQQIAVTFKEALVGFLLSIVIGISLGLIMSQSKAIERSLYPYAILMQTIPVVAIAPLIVIWFGPGFWSIVILAFVMSVFPIISNVTTGLTSTDHNLLDLFHLYGVNRLERFIKLQMPFALPYVMTGLKISSGMSVIGAIVGEFVAGMGGGEGGLGYAILSAGVQLDTPYLFVCAIAAAAMGILIFSVVNWISYLLLGRWHDSYVSRG